MKYNDLIVNLSLITHDEKQNIDKKYFNDNYGFKKVPVVFKRAFNNLEIKKKWTRKYLIQNITQKEMVDNNEKKMAGLLMTLKEYYELNSKEYYFRTNQHVLNKISNDYKVPSSFYCWYANTKISTPKNRLSWLYVGLTDTYSDLHRDLWNTSAWNFLIKGKKLWLIYPEIYNSEIKSNKDEYNAEEIIKNPNKILCQKAKPMICVQEEGDLIYIPGNNYHAVINLTETISLTENFINETNYDDVRDYFRKGKNKNNKSAIEAIIKEGFEQLTT